MALVVTAASIISRKIQNGGILVPAYPGSSGKWPLNECYCYWNMLERIVNLEKQLEESKAECLHLRQQLSSTENGMKPSEPEASVVNQQPTTDGDCDLRTLTKDSVVIARHMRQLNSVIGSLRAEKLALTTQLRKHQLRITHLENTVDRLSNEVGVTNSNRIPLEYEHVRLLTRSDAV